VGTSGKPPILPDQFSFAHDDGQGEDKDWGSGDEADSEAPGLTECCPSPPTSVKDVRVKGGDLILTISEQAMLLIITADGMGGTRHALCCAT